MYEYNIIYYRVKYTANRRAFPASTIFDSFIDIHLEENNFICFTVKTAFYQKVHLSTDFPETDYIIFDNQQYAGIQLFDLYRKIHTEAIENAIEELD